MSAIVINKTVNLNATVRETLEDDLTFTGEKNAHKFVIAGIRNGSPVNLSGTVTAQFICPDNATVPINGAIEGGKAAVTLSDECYEVPGRFRLSIFNTDGGATVCIYSAVGTVRRTTTNRVVDRGTIPNLNELQQAAQNIAGVEHIDIAQTKSGNVITVTTTNRNNVKTNKTITEPTAVVSKDENGPYRLTVKDANGTTGYEIPDPAAEVKKKANLEAVTVKKTVGPAEMVTFEDGVDAPAVLTKIKLEPKQDLHGYDHPWVGGAGKNLLDFADYTLTKPDARTKAAGLSASIPPGNYIFSCDREGTAAAVSFNLRDDANNNLAVFSFGANVSSRWSKAFTLETTATKVYTFISNNDDDGVTATLSNIMITADTEADQTYAPYSNICPIEGYDTVKVVRTGKNMLRGWAQLNNTSKTELIRVDFVNDNIYTVNIGSDFRDCKGMIYYYNENKEYVGRSVGSATWPFTVRPTTSISSDASGTLRENSIKYIQVVIYTGIPSPVTISVLDGLNVQVKCNDTGADYVDPNHNEISINLVSSTGSTVYGGELTLNEDGSGNIIIDKKTVKFSDLTWTYNNTFGFRSMNQNSGNWDGLGNTTGGQDASQTCCSAYERFDLRTQAAAESITYGYAIGSGVSVYRLLLKDLRFGNDVNAFLEAMGNETVCYTLATPSDPIPLTATQVQTLVGTNHVWTDAGEITLTYRSDKYAELERRISQLEALVLES